MSARAGRHHCWVYDEPEEFQARVQTFLSEGLDRGERVWYVGEGDPIGRLPGFDDAIQRGAAQVFPVGAAYATSPTEPQQQVDAFADALADALARGFTGIRVAADATTLAAAESWNRYEHLVDRFMVDRPITGLCGFDRHRLDPLAVARLESLHPLSNTNSAGFRLHACSPAADRAALHGELDFTNQDLLVRALSTADLEPENGEIVVEAAGVTFIDHNCVFALDRYAADRAATLVLRDPNAGADRLIHLLNPANVRAEWSA